METCNVLTTFLNKYAKYKKYFKVLNLYVRILREYGYYDDIILYDRIRLNTLENKYNFYRSLPKQIFNTSYLDNKRFHIIPDETLLRYEESKVYKMILDSLDFIDIENLCIYDIYLPLFKPSIKNKIKTSFNTIYSICLEKRIGKLNTKYGRELQKQLTTGKGEKFYKIKDLKNIFFDY